MSIIHIENTAAWARRQAELQFQEYLAELHQRSHRRALVIARRLNGWVCDCLKAGPVLVHSTEPCPLCGAKKPEPEGAA